MKLEGLQYAPVEVPREREFRIATGSSLSVKNALVRLSSNGHHGLGACAPNSVTGETMESIGRALAALKPKAVDTELKDIAALVGLMDQTISGNPAAKCGLDIAAHDIWARSLGVAVADMLGQVKACQLTDITLGIESLESTVAEASERVAEGFKALKLKVGLDLSGDVERVTAVRDAVGGGIRLWVDANQGYSVEEAIRFAKEVEHLGIEFLEQPVDKSDLQGLGRVRERSPIPVMADESARSPSDVEEIIRLGCVDMVNIKLMKCGGINKARRIAALCKDSGLPNMIGCMGETMVSIAGALHFALSEENVRYADLDSHFMLAENIAEGLDFRDGCLWPSAEPGLGITLKKELTWS